MEMLQAFRRLWGGCIYKQVRRQQGSALHRACTQQGYALTPPCPRYPTEVGMEGQGWGGLGVETSPLSMKNAAPNMARWNAL